MPARCSPKNKKKKKERRQVTKKNKKQTPKKPANLLGQASTLPGSTWNKWRKHVLNVGPTWLFVAVTLTHCLRCRISEVLALKSEDFNFDTSMFESSRSSDNPRRLCAKKCFGQSCLAIEFPFNGPPENEKIIDMMLFRNKKAIGKYYHKNMSGIYLI